MSNFTLTHATGVRVLGLIKDINITVPKFGEHKESLTTEVEAGRAYLRLYGEGRSSSHAVVLEKEADREAIYADVKTLVRVGRSAAENVQETKTYWKAGPAKQGQEKLLARGRQYVAKAKAHGVIAETAEMNAHTWPIGDVYDRAAAFAGRILHLDD